jgi:FkbM family methyltransferase
MKQVAGANRPGGTSNLLHKLRHKVFIYRTAGDALTRKLLSMREPDGAISNGTANLALRPMTEPVLTRVSPRSGVANSATEYQGEDDRRTIWELFFYRVYDSELPAVRWKTILDAGANIGLFMSYLRWIEVPIEKYVAIEPDPDNFRILQRQIEQQNMAGRSKLWQVAASNSTGTLRFANNKPSIMRSISDDGNIEVQSMPLIDIINQSNLDQVDLFKLDIEGGERFVMQGVKDWAPRVKRIATELHDDMDFSWLKKNLEPQGFRVFDMGVLFRGVHGAIREDLIDELPRHLR